MGSLFSLVVGIVVALDQQANRLPLYGCTKGIVLDTLLGPEDEFEYTSRTNFHN